MSDWKDIAKSRAFWLQVVGTVCLAAFEIGLTGVIEWWVWLMIVYVNGARLYLSIETPLLAKDNEFDAETLNENVMYLNWFNVAYMVMVIFLERLFAWCGLNPVDAQPTYLLLLFAMAGFAYYSVSRLKEKRDANAERKRESTAISLADLTQRDEEIARLKNEISQKSKEIASLTANVSQKQDLIEKASANASQMEGKIANLLRDSAKLKRLTAALKKPIARNNRYYKILFANDEAGIEECYADGRLKKKKQSKKINGVKLLVA